MSNPKIHVVIPVYNAEKFIEEAVNSVLAQPYQNLALYLIDDGSCDNSGALCDALAELHDNIHTIHQKNSGVSAARNSGIELVLQFAEDTDYLAFCDADDRWIADAVSYNFFDNNWAEIHTFGTICADQMLERFYIYAKFDDFEETEVEKVLWKRNPFCSNIYSIHMIREYGIRFSRMTRYAEDVMFSSQCKYCAKRIIFHKEFLYLYRHNANSAMHTRKNVSKINYYTQIINGWVETEEKINACAEWTGKSTTMGSTLASIYFLDMAIKHYQDWGSQKSLEQAFMDSPHLHHFMNMKQNSVSQQQFREQKLLRKHPTLFRLKHNLLGIVIFLIETAYRLPLVKKMYIRHKYKLAVLPQNRSDW